MLDMRASLSTVEKAGKSARIGHFYSILLDDWPWTSPAATIICTPCEAKLAKEPVLPKDIAGLSFEDALKELLKKKQAGVKIEAPKERTPAKVINLMDALRQSVQAERGGGELRKAPRRAAAQHGTAKKAGRSSRQKAG